MKRPPASSPSHGSAVTPTTAATAIADERERSARRVALIRAIAAGSFAAVAVVLGGVARLDVWRTAVTAAVVYATLAGLALAAVRRSRELAVASGTLVAVLDVGATYVIERGMMASASVPEVVVAFNLATMCAFVVIASMWMQTRTTVLTAAAGALSQSALFIGIGAASAAPSVVVILGLVAAACVTASSRVQRLVASTTEHLLAQRAAELEAERVAQEQGRSFRDLVDGLPDGALVANGGSIRYANAKLAEMVQESRGDLVGRSVTALAAHDDAASLEAHLVAAASGEGAPVELFLRRADGRRTPVEVSSTRLVVEGVPSTVSVVRDIAERKIVHGQLLLANRMASMGTLAATIAHDINNPVAVVQANLAYLSEQLTVEAPARPASEEVLAALDDSREAVLAVGAIVRDLKTFTRVDDDTVEPVDLRGVVESSLRLAHNQIRARARLVCELHSVGRVNAVASRLGQVVVNLLVNAAQAIPEGDPDASSVFVRTSDEGEHVVIEIQDTGAGMTPEVQARVFEPFFTTKPVGVGTGLGLAVCERIVAAMSGRIEVTSAPGEGATFRVVLPAYRGRSAASVKRLRAHSRGVPRVLAVDDEPAMLSSIARLLGATCELSTVGSAKEALERITNGERFDVILCDLTMPGMTGTAFHDELSRVLPQQAARVAFVSGGAMSSSVVAYVEEHRLPLLKKPFAADDLRALVTKTAALPNAPVDVTS